MECINMKIIFHSRSTQTTGLSMDGWHTLVLMVEGAAALTLLHVARRYNLSIPEGRKTVSTVQYTTVQYSTVQYSTVQYSTGDTTSPYQRAGRL